LFIITTSHYLL